jgi:thiamine transport system permease protein
MRPGAFRDSAYRLPIVAFVAAFALLPVLVLFAGALASADGLAGLARLLADPLNQAAFRNSVEQGAWSAVAAVAVGYPIGVFLGRYRWRGQSFLRALLLVPFLLPSLVVVFGVEALFARGGWVASAWSPTEVLGSGLPAIIFANLLFNAPIVVLLTAVGVEGAPVELEESVATLGGSPARAYRDVWGPPSWAGAAAGGVLTFVFSALAFASPLLLCGARCYTLEVRVWSLDQQLLEPNAAAVLALAMVLLLALPTAAYLGLVGRMRAGASKHARRSRPVPWRNPLAAAAGVASAGFVALVVLFLAAVVARGLNPLAVGGGGLASLVRPTVGAALGVSIAAAVGNTLFFAVLSAAIALLLGITAGFSERRRARGSAWVPLLIFLPLLFSPIVLSLALSTFWRPLLGGTSSTWLLIIVSQTMLALPFAWQSLRAALGSTPVVLGESARVLGASPWAAYLDVEVPPARRGLLAAAMLAFTLGLGEFTATNLLATPTFTTLPVAIYRLDAVRLVGPAEAAAALLVLVSVAALLFLVGGGRRVEL